MNKDDKILQSLHSIHFYPILEELRQVVNGKDLNAMRALHFKTLNLLYEPSFYHAFDPTTEEEHIGCIIFSFKYGKHNDEDCNHYHVSTLFGHSEFNIDFPQIIHRINTITICNFPSCYIQDKIYKSFYGFLIHKDMSIVSKISKEQLQELCDENGISYKSTYTKIKLVKKLMSI